MIQNIKQSRRDFIGKAGRITAFGLLAAHSPSTLAETFASANLESASDKPAVFTKVLDSSEIGVGAPTRYLPKSSILKAALESGANGSEFPVQAWMKLLIALKDADPVTQINMVNGFFNQVRYIGEGRQDAWKMPTQFLSEGGDCEDFAIAKFVSLRLLGFHPDRVRLLFVENTLTGIDHAVVSVQYNQKNFVLDNNLTSVVLGDRLGHYLPICSFDERRMWVHWKPGHDGTSVAALQQRLSKQS